ncbi:hypothetical protein CLAFUW4_14820 [Fulvia fulva]|nr:hypothetical protein CLAFUR0_14813 [Fulvia fulva]WPV22997.1 hypothetical protein CLAFUW4_14820 [Fulvia fulva]WPV37946.1 hypothetical protein CLAFUW7_14821 [Fulvia fulva]
MAPRPKSSAYQGRSGGPRSGKGKQPAHEVIVLSDDNDSDRELEPVMSGALPDDGDPIPTRRTNDPVIKVDPRLLAARAPNAGVRDNTLHPVNFRHLEWSSSRSIPRIAADAPGHLKAFIGDVARHLGEAPAITQRSNGKKGGRGKAKSRDTGNAGSGNNKRKADDALDTGDGHEDAAQPKQGRKQHR